MAYSSHRGINVSQYIANLNAVDPDDLVQNDKPDDLSLFTNTHFFDFDMGRATDAGVAGEELPYDNTMAEQDRRRRTGATPKAPSQFDVKQEQQQQQHQQRQHQQHQPSAQQFDFLAADYLGYTQAAQPLDVHSSSPVAHGLILNNPPPPADLSTAATPVSGVISYAGSPGNKRFGSLEDSSSRLAAEEDKRRRNTAASARFRIKKKQREQQMEQVTKDLQDKVQQLETKIMQLEMENKWLKNLVVEKNEAKATSQILNSRSQDSAEEASVSDVSGERKP
ncbi:uncharacterized protein V2V93DRAFT_363667 [Kockiozyma suomiensis]|uniref:uncharacterized protein n=1 Tax=Kockiozyma suomiensis TaxID=1337062 RepID=UPI003343B947